MLGSSASTSDEPRNRQAAVTSVVRVPIATATGPATATASPSGLKTSEPNQSYDETREEGGGSAEAAPGAVAS